MLVSGLCLRTKTRNRPYLVAGANHEPSIDELRVTFRRELAVQGADSRACSVHWFIQSPTLYSRRVLKKICAWAYSGSIG